MIIREWRGRAHRKNAEAYAEHFRSAVAPQLEAIDGFCGADLIRRSLGDETVEYTVLSRWESMKAVRQFAADDPSQAAIERGAVAALVDFDEIVAHHQVVFTMSGEGDATQ